MCWSGYVCVSVPDEKLITRARPFYPAAVNVFCVHREKTLLDTRAINNAIVGFQNFFTALIYYII